MSDIAFNSALLADMCIGAGADDVGFVELGRSGLESQCASVLAEIPWGQTVIVMARRLNKQSIRVPMRSISSTEFTEGSHDINAMVRRVERELWKHNFRAVGISGFFPMDFSRLPGLPWLLSLKDMAVAAGLGAIGRNRLVLHPRYGANIYLGAVVIDRPVSDVGKPLSTSPCLNCNLCAATCPTGAIAKDGHFDFGACLTHNYREKMGGFVEWVHTLADSRNRRDYQRRVSDAETLSWWQSLGYEAATHCDYCMAVCPAGDEAASYLTDRKPHFRTVVRPLRDRGEAVYVVPGSDAEEHVAKAFPHKKPRRIGSGRSADSIGAFIGLLPHLFQRGQAKGLAARYHFRFRGREVADATVEIRDQKIAVHSGLVGKADLRVTADSDAWLGFIAKSRFLPWQLVLGRVRLRGSPRLLIAFGKCFPS